MAGTIKLTITKGKLKDKEYVFRGRTRCTIGRADDCDIRFPYDWEFMTISRHHCLLDMDPPHIRVRDLGSSNGTYISGRQIGRPAPDLGPADAPPPYLWEYDLEDGDELGIGDTALRVSISPCLQPKTQSSIGVSDPASPAREGHLVLS